MKQTRPGGTARLRPSSVSASMSFALGNAFAGPRRERYLGIDPGLNRTGYTLLRRTAAGPYLEEAGVITSTRDLTLAERVTEIGQGIVEVIEEFEP